MNRCLMVEGRYSEMTLSRSHTSHPRRRRVPPPAYHRTRSLMQAQAHTESSSSFIPAPTLPPMTEPVNPWASFLCGGSDSGAGLRPGRVTSHPLLRNQRTSVQNDGPWPDDTGRFHGHKGNWRHSCACHFFLHFPIFHPGRLRVCTLLGGLFE
jgi:hypothetical protein